MVNKEPSQWFRENLQRQVVKRARLSRERHIIKVLQEDGVSFNKVAKILQTSVGSVGRIAKKYGIQSKHPKGFPINFQSPTSTPETIARRQAILAALEKGESVAAIAKRFDVTRQYIYKVKSAAG